MSKIVKKVALLTALMMSLMCATLTQAAGKVGLVKEAILVAKDTVFTEIATAPTLYIEFQDAITNESGSGLKKEVFYVEIANAEFTDKMFSQETIQAVDALSITKENKQVAKVIIQPTSRERRYFIPLLVKLTGGDAQVAIRTHGGDTTLLDWGSTDKIEEKTDEKPILIEEPKTKINTIQFTMGSKAYVYNGESFDMDAAAYIEKPGYMMIPLIYVSKVVGVEGKDIAYEKGVITLNLKGDIQLVLNAGSKQCKLGDKEITLDAPAIIKGNRTYIPVGAVAKLLGIETKWHNETKTAEFISSN